MVSDEKNQAARLDAAARASAPARPIATVHRIAFILIVASRSSKAIVSASPLSKLAGTGGEVPGPPSPAGGGIRLAMPPPARQVLLSFCIFLDLARQTLAGRPLRALGARPD